MVSPHLSLEIVLGDFYLIFYSLSALPKSAAKLFVSGLLEMLL